MPDNPREITTMAERSFPVRIRIGVPPGGLGQRLTQMTAWLDGRWLGDDAFGNARAAERAISIYFAEATLASAFVAVVRPAQGREDWRRVPDAGG